MACRLLASLLVALSLVAGAALGGSPDETLRSAAKVLSEIKNTPGKQIPDGLLTQAQAVVVVPDAIKFGLIGGVRSGYGVVVMREIDGTWGLPQFVTLAGGSVGLQAGVEDVDMVLVFMSKTAAEGLTRGKFTVGTDASASAGPVGRDNTSVTDGRSRSDILAYSRSRGLFIGASIDGARIEIDNSATRKYYNQAPGKAPARVPEAATALRRQIDLSAAAAKQAAGPRYDPQPKPGHGPHYIRPIPGMQVGS